MKIAETLFIGQSIQHFDSLPSTNDYLVEQLKSAALAEGTLVFADHQFAGKGQAGNRWESAPSQNIAMSILLMPRFLLATHQFYLNMVSALAVKSAISSFVPHTTITQVKWPNDILLDGKKFVVFLFKTPYREIKF